MMQKIKLIIQGLLIGVFGYLVFAYTVNQVSLTAEVSESPFVIDAINTIGNPIVFIITFVSVLIPTYFTIKYSYLVFIKREQNRDAIYFWISYTISGIVFLIFFLNF